jgi:WD40 repeat protein
MIAFSPDGAKLAAGYDGRTVRLWETATRRALTNLWHTKTGIKELHFSPDGKTLAISTSAKGTEGVIELRDVQTGALIGQPMVHRDEVKNFEFSRDGRWLATACEDHTSRVWDAHNGNPVTPWMQHDFECQQIHFSPDGERVATMASRGTVRLWNARTGEPLISPVTSKNESGHATVAISADGRQLLSATSGQAWIRDLTPDNAPIEELRMQAQAVSCTRLDPVTGILPLDNSSLSNAWRQFRTLRAAR